MAKEIKAIQCPKCGSIYKEELKPDFFKCTSCGTEYYLDSDDQHIYFHDERAAPVQSSSPPVNKRLSLYGLAAVVSIFVIIYLGALAWLPRGTNRVNSISGVYKVPRMYYSSFVYTNSVTGDPVYLRLGTETINPGGNKPAVELHAQFNNAVNGKLIADRIVPENLLSGDRCSLDYHTISSRIYVTACKTKLLEIDSRNNQLKDVTAEVFKDFPEFSSGIAKVDFEYSRDVLSVMNNEGTSFYYFPTLHKMVGTAPAADQLWAKEVAGTSYEFTYLGNVFDEHQFNQLVAITYDKNNGDIHRREVTPGRKYFSPKVLYHDKDNLLIVAGTTAAQDPPVSIQSIDIQSGKLKWALPPDHYDLYSSTKCRQGFAIEYRRGEEADYVHGVLVISDMGKVVYNYKLGRLE